MLFRTVQGAPARECGPPSCVAATGPPGLPGFSARSGGGKSGGDKYYPLTSCEARLHRTQHTVAPAVGGSCLLFVLLASRTLCTLVWRFSAEIQRVGVVCTPKMNKGAGKTTWGVKQMVK